MGLGDDLCVWPKFCAGAGSERRTHLAQANRRHAKRLAMDNGVFVIYRLDDDGQYQRLARAAQYPISAPRLVCRGIARDRHSRLFARRLLWSALSGPEVSVRK